MPAQNPLIVSAEPPPNISDAAQAKQCRACQRLVGMDTVLLSEDTLPLCATCTEALRSSTTRTSAGLCVSTTALPVRDSTRDSTGADTPRFSLRRRTPSLSNGSRNAIEAELESDEDSENAGVDHEAPVPSSSRQVTEAPGLSPVATPSLDLDQFQHVFSPSTSCPSAFVEPPSPSQASSCYFPSPPKSSDRTSHSSRDVDAAYSDPDPLVDITRLRMRPRGFRCLQPGATFKGVQKSGRSSYEVNVTLLNVDFASSTLCGYLRICGLTEGWPELTTYFDAEIVGMRYGFDTQAWGASRHDDEIHWSRFPAFRQLQKDLIEPRLTLPNNTSRNAIFMRWKERFLVPDHHVQDILGASFAGFYYVCVEFDPRPELSPSMSQTSSYDSSLGPCIESGFAPGPYPAVVADPASDRWRSCAEPRAPAPATMTGFYFHQNSEPYQQLSLTHVPKRFHSSCEFR